MFCEDAKTPQKLALCLFFCRKEAIEAALDDLKLCSRPRPKMCSFKHSSEKTSACVAEISLLFSILMHAHILL